VSDQWGKDQQGWDRPADGNWHPEGLPPAALGGSPMPGAPEYGRPFQGGPVRGGPSPMQGGPMPGGPEKYPAPVDVETARHLWFGVVVLGLFGMVLGLYSVYSDRATFIDQLLDEMARQDPSLELGSGTAETVMMIALGVSAVLALGFAALSWLIVNKMRAGKMWARTVLTVIGAVVVVTSLPSLFALGSAEGAVSVVSTVAGLLQAVLAAGAVVLMHRKESNAYFVAQRAPRA
jgi:drug/metabolite transporter (DMT)-like permease